MFRPSPLIGISLTFLLLCGPSGEGLWGQSLPADVPPANESPAPGNSPQLPEPGAMDTGPDESDTDQTIPPPAPLPKPAKLEEEDSTLIPPAPAAATFEVAPVSEVFDEPTDQRRWQLEEQPDVPELISSSDAPENLSIIPSLSLGSFTVAAGFQYDALYDSNVLLTSADTQGDFIHILTPRLSIALGDYVNQRSDFLALAYEPQIMFFQHYHQYNSVNQQIRLDGQEVTTNTKTQETLEYDQNSDPDRELQGRLTRDIFSSRTQFSYDIFDRITLQADGLALIRNYQQEINSDEGRLRLGVRYTATPSWSVALEGAGGAVLPDEGDTQLIEQAFLAVNGQFGNGFNLDFQAGADVREPQGSGRTISTPVFDATLQYSPSSATQVELRAVREIFTSPDMVDQDYVSTRANLKVNQRLWDVWNVSVEGGVENADYIGFDQGAGAVRCDNYPYERLEVKYGRFQDLQVSVYYVFRQNFSTSADLSFSDQQAGIQFRVGY